MRIVLINYNYLPGYSSPQQWINKIKPSAIILEALGKDHSVFYAGQIAYAGDYCCNGVKYHFFDPKKRSRFPSRLHSFVKELNPDVVLVPGFHFLLQVIQLRLRLGKKVKIILEHHADKPFRGIKKFLQKTADKYIDAYHFTALGNAQEWLDAGIISNKNKCHEIPANSSYFLRQDKEQSKLETGMDNAANFLWVGRLQKNKDPLTVLKGFEKFLSTGTPAKLYMIYQATELLPEIEELISKSDLLQPSVSLCRDIPHAELATWYSAADFYISGSHREGGSIALVEAMSCGCIPVVTAIPSALEVIEYGNYGFYYEPGNKDDLSESLLAISAVDRKSLSGRVENHFKETLSADAIAKRFIMLAPGT